LRLLIRVLGIESSCDETAAAVVQADGMVLSDVVRSQVEAHAPYGGVVPEIAARDHLRAIAPVVESALADAGLSLADVSGVAVTHRPGLVGALLVGVQVAKGLAWASGKPLVGVDHLVGHLLSVFVRREDETATPTAVRFPFVGLLVSGGHTALYLCEGPRISAIQELGATRDDAVGEAYDKVAKLLGLGYPGGPLIDRLASRGEASKSPLALKPPMAHRESLEFSFSGLKSAVARHVAAHGIPDSDEGTAHLCAAFQDAVVTTLVRKTLRATKETKVSDVVIAGGVAANSALRARARAACDERGLRLHVPDFRLCTDNAAMIAYAGAVAMSEGRHDSLDLGPSPHTALPRHTRKGRGKRVVTR
jgi:N6-L-threonylcarbamoyladenine synthase